MVVFIYNFYFSSISLVFLRVYINKLLFKNDFLDNRGTKFKSYKKPGNIIYSKLILYNKNDHDPEKTVQENSTYYYS